MAARLGDEGLAGFNSRQMGGWIDRQMDGQPDIASAFEPGPRVAGPFWTSSGLCSRPCGRVGCPGAVPAIVPSLLPAPAARWLPATPNNCVLIGKGKKKRTELYSSFLGRHSWRKAMPNQLGRGAKGWHRPGTACQPVTGSSVWSWSCSGMGLKPPGKALAAARGAGASIPISRRASPLPGAACESRPPLLAPQPGRERAVSDVHEEKN